MRLVPIINHEPWIMNERGDYFFTEGGTFPTPITAVEIFFSRISHHWNFGFYLDATLEEKSDVRCAYLAKHELYVESLLCVATLAIRRSTKKGTRRRVQLLFRQRLRQRAWECESLSKSALNFDALYAVSLCEKRCRNICFAMQECVRTYERNSCRLHLYVTKMKCLFLIFYIYLRFIRRDFYQKLPMYYFLLRQLISYRRYQLQIQSLLITW